MGTKRIKLPKTDWKKLDDKFKWDTSIDLGIGSEQGLWLLAEQKRQLCNLMTGEASEDDDPEILEGLLSMLDYIQDTLADGIPEKLVFPFRDKGTWEEYNEKTGKWEECNE